MKNILNKNLIESGCKLYVNKFLKYEEENPSEIDNDGVANEVADNSQNSAEEKEDSEK